VNFVSLIKVLTVNPKLFGLKSFLKIFQLKIISQKKNSTKMLLQEFLKHPQEIIHIEESKNDVEKIMEKPFNNLSLEENETALFCQAKKILASNSNKRNRFELSNITDMNSTLSFKNLLFIFAVCLMNPIQTTTGTIGFTKNSIQTIKEFFQTLIDETNEISFINLNNISYSAEIKLSKYHNLPCLYPICGQIILRKKMRTHVGAHILKGHILIYVIFVGKIIVTRFYIFLLE
jgi:hypothetical protein